MDIATHADGTMGVDRYHYAVYAKRDLAVDTPVVTAIPKAACLSARTCSVAETLKAARLGKKKRKFDLSKNTPSIFRSFFVQI